VRLGRRLHDDSNMGSTLTCCRLAGDVLLVGHVGDSAAYLLGPEDGIRRLTRDDTPVSGLIEAGLLTADEGRRHPMAHLLTQALGYGPLTPHVDEVRVEPGAVVMVCSDGLSDVVDDTDLAGALGDEPEAAAGTLLDLALATGAPDNVTVVVGRVESG
jgi:serine/threonine protein phosphatase PrpC